MIYDSNNIMVIEIILIHCKKLLELSDITALFQSH